MQFWHLTIPSLAYFMTNQYDKAPLDTIFKVNWTKFIDRRVELNLKELTFGTAQMVYVYS